MAVQPSQTDQAPSSVSWLNNPTTRSIFFQVVLTLAVLWLGWVAIDNMVANRQASDIKTGFGFLWSNAGTPISQTLIEYNPATSTYFEAFLVGLLNTLLVAFFGIIFATIIGFLVGIARLSSNWMISKIAAVYIEVFRNIPLLLHIFIWYFGVLRLLPKAKDSWDLGFFGLLNNRGYFVPKPIWGNGAGYVLAAFLVAIVAAFFLSRWAKARQMKTGQRFPTFLSGLGLIIGLPLVVFLVLGMPLSFDFPVAGGFRPKGGFTLIPEFVALLIALSTYTATFIAEIVRAGILAVSKGQSEAAHALGLRNGTTLRLVVIPQAMRIIIPPLTSQFLNLTKNSSLAVAIAYPELTSVFAGSAQNQTGLAVEIIGMTMMTYLVISLITAGFMNWYNSHVALVER